MAAPGVIAIDENSMRQIMGYLRIDDHDIFVGYIRKLGIEHKDQSETSKLTKIFVNLAVKDLKKSIDFFSKLGFKFNPLFFLGMFIGVIVKAILAKRNISKSVQYRLSSLPFFSVPDSKDVLQSAESIHSGQIDQLLASLPIAIVYIFTISIVIQLMPQKLTQVPSTENEIVLEYYHPIFSLNFRSPHPASWKVVVFLVNSVC